MAEDVEAAPVDAGGSTASLAAARKALDVLVRQEPDRHPLVIAVVAPLGVPLDPVERGIAEAVRAYGYRLEPVRLSRLLDDSPYRPWGELPDEGHADYYIQRMDAGDRLRTDTNSGAALAALAVAKVAALRGSHGSETVYLLRGLKHPDEVELLRHVYGQAFTLIGITSSLEERRQDLVERLSLFGSARADAEDLIERDESDPKDPAYGQNVRAVFSSADAYIATDRGTDPYAHISRIVDSLFGHPFLTPYPEEEGMRLAFDASLRSAAVGRQVGAALIPLSGTPVVVGTNEVPKPGGGQFWMGDEPDFRDFQTGMDPNPIYIQRLLQDILERLKDSGWLAPAYLDKSGVDLVRLALTKDADGRSILTGSRASALIEFVRCLHAEQAAIVNAARSGVATAGARLFTTTFPCHECAKVILGAGIESVFYIEPYPKSLVDRLYRDLIDTEPTSATERRTERLPFRPFLGIAPRRYAIAFVAKNRQQGMGAAGFDRLAAHPIPGSWSESAVQGRENSVASALFRIFAALDPSLSGLLDEQADGEEGPSSAPAGENETTAADNS